jgi:hypothetical protein
MGRGPFSRAIRAAAALAAVLSLANCATAEKQMYVDWIAVANPAEVCAGKSDCVQHATYKGRDLCRIVTADKNVSYARLGEQMRECLRQTGPAVAATGS